jgi:hypothetical protein
MKKTPPPEVTMDVHVVDPYALAVAIADRKVPVSAMGIDLAFLRRWATKEYKTGACEFGLSITPREIQKPKGHDSTL